MMTHPAPHRNPAPRKARAERCAHCGIVLTRPGTVIPGLGVVGPKCAQHVAARLLHLQRAGLGVLAVEGEQRLPAVRLPDGTLRPDPEALRSLSAAAGRVGVSLSVIGYDAATGTFLVVVTPGVLRAFVLREEGVQA